MGKILIIDDENAVREELRDRIEVMGHDVDEAGSVEEALKCLNEIAYDCVLLDLGIPRNFEGPTSIHHGRTLLQRIVASQGAPPVLVITANGLNDHQLATDMFENGAKGFIAKPFAKQPIEEKITKQIESHRRGASSTGSQTKHSFKGGNLVRHEDRIELCGEEVGGKKGNALIRQILPHLARKNEKGNNIKASRGDLAAAIGGDVGEPAIGNAIKDFREKCILKLGCDSHDVIITHRSGGYQLADWITFQIGSEERVQTQAESDQITVMKELRRFKERTRRQISDRTGIPQARVKVALSKLDDAGKLNLKGSGKNARYFIHEMTVSCSGPTPPAVPTTKAGRGIAVSAQ